MKKEKQKVPTPVELMKHIKEVNKERRLKHLLGRHLALQNLPTSMTTQNRSR